MAARFLFSQNMETTVIKIKKAKLCKGGCIEATYTDTDGNEIIIKGKNRCHTDLKVAFAVLVPYFTDLTEQKEADRIDWSNLDSAENVELLRKIDVTGISIGGDSNNRIITVTGNRTLQSTRVLNLNAPGVEVDSESFDWEYVEDFDIAVENLLYEVKEYIVNRKWDLSQKEMNFDDNPDDPFAQAEATDSVASVEVHIESVA